MEKTAVIQVGIKALRKPNGDFAEATPIYMPAYPQLAQRETAVISGIEAVEAHFLKEYIEKRDKANRQKQN